MADVKTFSVLVVEDSPVESTLTQRMLAARGTVWSVKAVARLSDAVQHVSHQTVDIVLLDLHLPDSRGLATLAKMREAAPELPIVVLTGSEDEELGLEALREGAQDYLLKRQWGSALLSRTLRYAVERFRAEATLRLRDAYLRAIFDNAPIGIAVVSRELKLVESNVALAELVGRSHDELASLGLIALFHPDDAGCAADIQRLFDGAARCGRERVRLQRKEGEAVWADVAAIALQPDGRRTDRVMVIVQNVTDRELLVQEREQFVEEINRLRAAAPAS